MVDDLSYFLREDSTQRSQPAHECELVQKSEVTGHGPFWSLVLEKAQQSNIHLDLATLRQQCLNRTTGHAHDPIRYSSFP